MAAFRQSDPAGMDEHRRHRTGGRIDARADIEACERIAVAVSAARRVDVEAERECHLDRERDPGAFDRGRSVREPTPVIASPPAISVTSANFSTMS
jgi:hypothetical protein